MMMFEHSLYHCAWYMGRTCMLHIRTGDDRNLAVVGYYRNDDVCTESFVMSIIVFVYGSYKCQILVQLMTVVEAEGHYRNDDV